MRSSEVHALSFAELGFKDNYRFAVLATLPGFQPKTNRQQTFMKILAWGPTVSGFDEERLLYPICALKIYRVKTVSTRKNNP